MHVDVQVQAVRQLCVEWVGPVRRLTGLWCEAGARIRIVRGSVQICLRRFTLTDAQAAGQRSGVVEHTVVGDLQVVAPGMDKDAAAALRAVGNAHSIDTGRVALEITRIQVNASS